ncbi:Aste57867_21895 [Aphanomyces stellatus]|uniref:Aste57867_21895 protein n=1 Tax=Aphanomyces stellatus TaxID=120398 RepID=A0A485LIR1_9STRA|nr:hypothetical protein As57867_021826 [Aphanomyces stellatus]VFT98563.1 Aste57867_21895 [Aphanomyces stellatus]
MATEEAIVRARIAALKNLLEVRGRQSSSLMHKSGFSHKPGHTHPSPHHQRRPSYMPVSGRQPPHAARNLTWKPDSSTPVDPKSSTVPSFVGTSLVPSTSLPPLDTAQLSRKRPASAGATTLSLEDGRYRKTGRGFSLRREDSLPKSAIEVSAMIAQKELVPVPRDRGGTLATGTTPLPRPETFQVPSTATPLPGGGAQASVPRTEYCMFYNKLGECKKKNACLFVHDSRKIAICRKFLRGACHDGAKCKLSHQLDENKMPDCAMFLKGMCTRDGCHYRHVNVSRDAAICEAFHKGYCPDGATCRLKHEFPKSCQLLPSWKRPPAAAMRAAMHERDPSPLRPLADVAAAVSASAAAALADSPPPVLNIRPTIRFTPKVI